MKKSKQTVVLCVIDGLGIRNEKQGNAFALANTPNIDFMLKNLPNSILQASGEYVGLPKGQMGNSEVGHLNIGAGEVVYTGLSLIGRAIELNEYKTNPKFIKVFEDVKKQDSTLHLMGLLSPGGVHSLEEHLFLLIEAAHDFGLEKVSIHVFGDGRDVAPQSIMSSLEKLVNLTTKYNYQIASISGRFFAMDRDKMFDRVEKAYNAILGKKGNHFNNVIDYVNDQYKKNIFDEFIEVAFNPESNPVQDNDSIIFYNFRPDRARQLSHLFVGSEIYDFNPEHKVKINNFLSMMKYEGIEKAEIVFKEMTVENSIGKVMAENGYSQLRLAETQKYAHVTFFMDGGIDENFQNMDKIMIDSQKVNSYADAPEMSAQGITDKLLEIGNNYDLVIMNYANPDMVGHTGNLKSGIKAVEVLDEQLGRIQNWLSEIGGAMFITADHGNIEVTEDEKGLPATKHTSYPVFLITNDASISLNDGKLSNVAPTILDYMGIAKPTSMKENSLIKK